MSFSNRIRLPLYLSKAQFPDEANRFRLADGTSKTLSVVIRKTYELITDHLGEMMHQRLVIAINHDHVTIEGDRYAGDVVKDGDYEIAWQDWLDWPIAPATVKVQVSPFDATNSNCQICSAEDANNLNLADDDMGEIAEGTSASVNVFLNDTICCFPITAEIVFFDTTYIDSATIDETTGNATLTAKNPAPTVGSIVLATYRVTCPDGNYDEADIYGSIAGTAPACEQPAGFADPVFSAPPAPFSVDLAWSTLASPPACGYEWKLYKVDQPGLPVQTGTTATNSETITGLLSDTEYDFLIRSNCCGDTFSPYNHQIFTTPAPEPAENCARFQVVINDDTTSTDNIYFYDFMNCDGIIVETSGQNLTVHEHCMLTDGTGIAPFYFFVHGVDGPFFTVTYIEPC